MTAQPNSLDTCPVCLRKLKRCDILAQPESCGHQFCYICISEWAKNVNTCPVDRIKFNVINLCSKDGSQSKVYVPDTNLTTKNDEDVTFCEVCHECTREDRLLLCDGCDKGYHMECLIPPLGEIPEGNWYCLICQPIVASQVDVASSSQDESSMNTASDAEAFNNSAVSGTERKPIFIDDNDSDDADDDDHDGDDDDDDNSLSDSSSDGLETIGAPRRTARRIDDDDDDFNEDNKVPILSSPVRVFISPEFHTIEDNESSCSNRMDEIHDSDSSDHSGVHVRSKTRTRSSWRLVLSTSSSNCSTPRKVAPTSSVSDPLFPTAVSSLSTLPASKYALSPLSDSPFACPAAVTPQSSILLSSGGQINSNFCSDPLVDSILSPFSLQGQSCTTQHKDQKCRTPEVTQRDPNVLPSSGAHICDDPLISASTRVNKHAPRSANGQRGGMSRKTKAKRRRKMRKVLIKKEGKRLKKRRQSLQFVSNWKSDEDDPSYVPVVKSKSVALTPNQTVRTRARTVATHSPCSRDPTFTAAVIEAQRCPDSSDGLIKARAVLKGEQGSSMNRSALLSLSPSRRHSSNFGVTCSTRSEIERRIVPKKRLIQMLGNVPSPIPTSPVLRSASLPSAGATQESDLVGTICQKLDDLQSKHNFIKRDGTVIPIRQLESSLHEEKGDRVTLFSEPEFSPTTSPLIEAKTPQVEEPHEICNDVLVCSSSRSRTSVASSASSVLTRSITSRSMSRSKSSHTASFSGLKKSTSSNLSLSSNEVDPLAFNGDFPDSGTMAVDCLANGLLEAYASGRQAKTESSFKLDQSGTAGASTPSEELVKKFVYTHYIKRTITEREYHRIVERATKKVQAGSRFDVMRIKKLVEDYVLGYIKQRDMY